MKLRRSLRHATVARRARQRGLALLIVLLGVLGAFGLLFVSTVLKTSALVQQQRPALPTLDEGRLALIGASIGNMSTGQRPGTMPFPDGFASTEVPPDYDGNADGGCLDASKVDGLPQIANGANLRCLGRLPWKSLGMSVPAPSENDVAGMVPWYAVSGNLVDPACLTVLNSNTLSVTYTSFVCGGATLPYPWLTVRDGQGNVISNRVAVVLIMPGPPLSGQARPPSPNLAGASQYLDSATVGGTVYSNADMDNDFIIGEQSATFNDVVTYITIDDLMRDLEAAAASTALSAVANFRAATGAYPWLANFASPTSVASFVPTSSTRQGLVPAHLLDTDYPTGFQYAINRSGTFVYVNNKPGGTVLTSTMNSFTNVTRTVAPSAGACQWKNATASLPDPRLRVVCRETITTGLPVGVVSRVVDLDFITANAADVTIAAPTASTIATRSFNRTGTFSIVANASSFQVSDYNSGGSLVGQRYVTAGTSTGVAISNLVYPLNFYLPKWFVDNRWQEVLYGAMAAGFAPGAAQNCSTSCLTVGERTDIKFAIVAAGGSLSTQTRPSGVLTDYLEALGAVSNADADDVLTASHLPKSSTFNDQVFPIP